MVIVQLSNFQFVPSGDMHSLEVLVETVDLLFDSKCLRSITLEFLGKISHV